MAYLPTLTPEFNQPNRSGIRTTSPMDGLAIQFACCLLFFLRPQTKNMFELKVWMEQNNRLRPHPQLDSATSDRTLFVRLPRGAANGSELPLAPGPADPPVGLERRARGALGGLLQVMTCDDWFGCLGRRTRHSNRI